jgi:hypothetical protein
MALTLASTGGAGGGQLEYISLNNARMRTVKVTFDSSYAVGGESLTPTMFGLDELYTVIPTPSNGYTFEYDYTNQKLNALGASGGGLSPLFTNLTAVGNVTTGEDNLITQALTADTLNATKQGLYFESWGVTANNANTKTVKFYFGATAVLTQALTASIAGSWSISGYVWRTGSDTQDCIFRLNQGATDIAHAEFTATTIDEDAAITVKTTGESNSATDDIINEGLSIWAVGVPGASVEVPPATNLASVTCRVVAIGR